MRLTAQFRSSRRGPFLQVVKAVIATMVAWLVAGWIVGGQPPIFAAIASILVVQPSVNQSYTKAVERSAGMLAGVAIASILGILFGSQTWVVLLTAAVAMVAAWSLRMTAGASSQVGISAVLVLALGPVTPDYAFDRVVETFIGAIIGLVVNVLVVPPVAIAPARTAVDALASGIATAMGELASALRTPQTAAELDALLDRGRLLKNTRTAADTAIAQAEDSLALNPRARAHRDELAALKSRLDLYSPMLTQVLGMTRTYEELYDAQVATDPEIGTIADNLDAAAEELRAHVSPATAGTDATHGTADATRPLPVNPVAAARPGGEHWMLVGSLLVDLRRVHEALAPAA
jgi:uncharacterized membrane protein YgaE (UPF0421/DUF939 family)